MSFDHVLANLNSSQHAAVSSFADTLAILAGPGSGKTHTLTSRTAWLLHQGLQPWNIIVATFTVKAAREMKERIGKLIGNGLESKLVLGTFHSISRRYLARYGHLIDIKKDFGIADSADSLAIIKRIIKRHNLNIDPGAARSRISSRKAKGDHYVEAKPPAKSVDIQEFETCWTEYEEALKRSNLLDYDDLLLRCVQLLRTHPSCVSNVEAVLIDEFQDTNIVQFDLMRLFAAQRKRITIVGDPDQSIYGFRSAETKNFKRLLRQYPETVTIALEENYRSSGAILLTALGVIEQDTSRIAKSLMPTHTVGTKPVLRKLGNAHKEAEWLVSEIQRCLGLTGTLLDGNDFAILLRSAALSRLIESALGKAGIAYRMVGGHRFYDRVEVKIILDYLRVINQPDNNDALARIINVPSRRIGETTVKAMLEEAEQSSTTLWSLLLDTAQGNRTMKTKLGKEADRNIGIFIDLVLKARKKIASCPDQKYSTVELIDYVVSKSRFEDFLEKKYSEDHESRWANIQELRNQAHDFEAQLSEEDEEALPEIDGLEQDGSSNPLSKFLANIALASEVKKDNDGPEVPQVTISTIHAAKGLEWPIVFIPAAYQGSIPHSRAEDSDEERRLLYVAMTRAKALLYISLPLKNSQGEETTLSPFLSPLSLSPLLDKQGPKIGSSLVQTFAQILGRPLPSVESIAISSSNLKCSEDSLFSLEGGEGFANDESRWAKWDGQHNFTMGQRAPKRQRTDAHNMTQDIVEVPWKGGHITTMDQATKFTTAGFVTAGSHMTVLAEQSINRKMDMKEQEDAVQMSKISSRRTSKRPEGQTSLHGFLGKRPPQTREDAASSKRQQQYAPVVPQNCAFQKTANTVVRVEIPPFDKSSLSIAPSLANHRIGPSSILPRPKAKDTDTALSNNEYVFLSSSPPRPTRSKLEHEMSSPPTAKSTGLTEKPSILPHLRPPKAALKRCASDTVQKPLKDRVTDHGVVEPKESSIIRAQSGRSNIAAPAKPKRPPVSSLLPPDLPLGSSARTLHKQSVPVTTSMSMTVPDARQVEKMQVPETRPATTFHTTSMSMLAANTGKRTLGVRRSMTAWSSKGQGFKPPTMSRPAG
ncbi:p-loop containing nucleoside triphosphate hydrolase-26 [Coleophoma cylindrospora]|uniref:DNA 3'-5' helicase n=1 Tax=Coleophoma cylindrospora TaxID=1849047 RepID=A0A3D8QXC0_9HELO|nr:p-loop containing nucleoside triphosphate hydrolase-26 [Coleophoma cylindrospora]